MTREDRYNAVLEFIKTIDDDGDYEHFGIRTQDEEFELGELHHVSHVWVDGEETEEELDGVSTTWAYETYVGEKNFYIQEHFGLREDSFGYYFGEHCAIIAGNRVEGGEDIGELIINDPVVVCVIC